MKKMMLGLFLMLLSIWCLIFGIADHADLFIIVAVALPVFAIYLLSLRYFSLPAAPLVPLSKAAKQHIAVS